MIRFAEQQDKAQIKSIWAACFGDAEDYIDFFFAHLPDVECLVYEKEEKIVSLFFLLRCSLDRWNGRYIFAACTLAPYRQQGIMAELLRYAASFYRTRCDYLCLVPATTSLFAYYSRLGYQPYFVDQIWRLKNTASSIKNIQPLSEAAFMELRAELPAAVRWGREETRLLFKENLFNGGKNIRTKSGYVILREAAENCEVIEWLSKAYDPAELLGLTACRVIIARSPVKEQEKTHVNGMVNFLNATAKYAMEQIKNPYLSLVLD